MSPPSDGHLTIIRCPSEKISWATDESKLGIFFLRLLLVLAQTSRTGFIQELTPSSLNVVAGTVIEFG